jgi:tetraacyldisaccharide 4'-kinase
VNERQFLDVISGTQRSRAAGVIRCGLSALTPFYRTAVSTRNRLFDIGARPVHNVGVPVVSIGNLTTGGTGKTPMVAWLTGWLQQHGRIPCIVSRGYQALEDRTNDEYRVLEQLCPGVPHLQNRDRIAAAGQAVEQHRPDVIILDDGFQHRRLHRDVDIVLIDALNPWGYGRLLPRGLLREPASSLRRADAVVITRADQVDAAALLKLREGIVRLTAAPVAEVAFRPRHLLAPDRRTAELRSLADQKLLGFCGIGNPRGFEQTLADAGLPDVRVEAFPDHHHYTADDLRRLKELASARQAAALVTTQKDLVKLDPQWLREVPVWAVVIGTEFRAGREALESLLSEQLHETGRSSAE